MIIENKIFEQNALKTSQTNLESKVAEEDAFDLFNMFHDNKNKNSLDSSVKDEIIKDDENKICIASKDDKDSNIATTNNENEAHIQNDAKTNDIEVKNNALIKPIIETSFNLSPNLGKLVFIFIKY